MLSRAWFAFVALSAVAIVMCAGGAATASVGVKPAAINSAAINSAAINPAPPTPALVPVDAGPNGYFEYTLAPGQAVDASLVVRNPGAGGVEFVVSPADAMTSSATGVVYGGFGDTLQATGRWIEPSTQHAILAAGGAQTVTFHLVVPAGTGPGDYVAGLSAENRSGIQPSNADSGAGISLVVNTRAIVAVVVHVLGVAPVLIDSGVPTVAAQNGNQQVVSFALNDTGGRLAKPTLAAEIRSCGAGSGPLLATLNRHLDTIVPHTVIVYSWPLGQTVLAAGCQRITVSVSLGGVVLSKKVAEVVVTPAAARVVVPVLPGAERSSPSHRPETATPNGVSSVALIAGVPVAIIVLALLVMAAIRSRRRRQQLEGEIARLKAEAKSPHD